MIWLSPQNYLEQERAPQRVRIVAANAQESAIRQVVSCTHTQAPRSQFRTATMVFVTAALSLLRGAHLSETYSVQVP